MNSFETYRSGNLQHCRSQIFVGPNSKVAEPLIVDRGGIVVAQLVEGIGLGVKEVRIHRRVWPLGG